MAIKSSDQITVVDLTDGYSVNLTNDSFTFAGDKDGKIATQQSTTTVIQALRGDEEPTISVDNSQITKPSGVTTSWNANTKTLTITVSTSVASGGVVTIPVVLDGSVTINKVFSFAIAKTGATGETGATGYLLQQLNIRSDRQAPLFRQAHGAAPPLPRLHRDNSFGQEQRSTTRPALILSATRSQPTAPPVDKVQPGAVSHPPSWNIRWAPPEPLHRPALGARRLWQQLHRDSISGRRQRSNTHRVPILSATL